MTCNAGGCGCNKNKNKEEIDLGFFPSDLPCLFSGLLFAILLGTGLAYLIIFYGR